MNLQRQSEMHQLLFNMKHLLPLRPGRKGHESQSRQALKIAGVECQERIPMFDRLCGYPQVVITWPVRPG